MLTKLEYIWLDGTTPTSQLRSKTKIVKDFKKSIIEIGKHFNIEFDLTGIDELYQEFYKRNQILKTHYKVKDYLNGNKSIALDILQQAYVDAQTN